MSPDEGVMLESSKAMITGLESGFGYKKYIIFLQLRIGKIY